jgi:hypothetical protein
VPTVWWSSNRPATICSVITTPIAVVIVFLLARRSVLTG